MVETKKHKNGPSKLLMGFERAHWNAMLKMGIDKHFFLWASRSYMSLQYDQIFSRLNRYYISHHANWVSHTIEAWVDTSQGMSKHFPLEIKLCNIVEDKATPNGKKDLLIGFHMLRDTLSRKRQLLNSTKMWGQ